MEHAVPPGCYAAGQRWANLGDDGQLCGGNARIILDYFTDHTLHTGLDDSWLWLCRRGVNPTVKRAGADRCSFNDFRRINPLEDWQGQADAAA